MLRSGVKLLQQQLSVRSLRSVPRIPNMRKGMIAPVNGWNATAYAASRMQFSSSSASPPPSSSKMKVPSFQKQKPEESDSDFETKKHATAATNSKDSKDNNSKGSNNTPGDKKKTKKDEDMDTDEQIEEEFRKKRQAKLGARGGSASASGMSKKKKKSVDAKEDANEGGWNLPPFPLFNPGNMKKWKSVWGFVSQNERDAAIKGLQMVINAHFGQPGAEKEQASVLEMCNITPAEIERASRFVYKQLATKFSATNQSDTSNAELVQYYKRISLESLASAFAAQVTPTNDDGNAVFPNVSVLSVKSKFIGLGIDGIHIPTMVSPPFARIVYWGLKEGKWPFTAIAKFVPDSFTVRAVVEIEAIEKATIFNTKEEREAEQKSFQELQKKIKEEHEHELAKSAKAKTAIDITDSDAEPVGDAILDTEMSENDDDISEDIPEGFVRSRHCLVFFSSEFQLYSAVLSDDHSETELDFKLGNMNGVPFL